MRTKGLLAAPLLVTVMACGGCQRGFPLPVDTSAPRAAECVDPVGDSGDGLDLTKATVTTNDSAVSIRYAWRGSPPESGAVQWATSVASAEGRVTRQLGYRVVDGAESAYFVYDMATAKRTNVSRAGKRVKLAVGSLSLQFPTSAVAGLGAGWTWTTTFNIDGSDVDTCAVAN